MADVTVEVATAGSYSASSARLARIPHTWSQDASIAIELVRVVIRRLYPDNLLFASLLACLPHVQEQAI